MKKLPERPKLPKFTQEEINSPNNAIPIKKIKFVAKHFLTKETPSPCEFIGDFYWALREGITLILEIFFPPKCKRMEYFPIYFMNPVLT